ncbi:MAG: hypothetical protein IJM40_08770 [Synergistaceae bacterium]|nr:hypothetical protein [Synergistaceae bacterium]
MSKGGRPPVNIDKRLFETLCGLQCTRDEIAYALNCRKDALINFCKREYGKTFEQVFNEKRAAGKVSLRRSQWKLAEKSPAMAIFLGKNYLGQSDRQDLELSGKVNITSIADLMLEDYGQNTDNKDTEEDNIA